MFKMHYFSNIFSKISKRWGLSSPQRPLISNIGDLKLRDLAKLWFFKLIMMKSSFKRSVMTSFQWRRRYYVTEKRHHSNLTKFFHFVPSPQSKLLSRPVYKTSLVYYALSNAAVPFMLCLVEKFDSTQKELLINWLFYYESEDTKYTAYN